VKITVDAEVDPDQGPVIVGGAVTAAPGAGAGEGGPGAGAVGETEAVPEGNGGVAVAGRDPRAAAILAEKPRPESSLNSQISFVHSQNESSVSPFPMSFLIFKLSTFWTLHFVQLT